MATAPKKTKPPPATEEPKRRGRPPGRTDRTPRQKTAENYTVSYDLDVLAWLRAHADGPAAVVNRALRREMERERRASKK